jgi:hypothetical protein
MLSQNEIREKTDIKVVLGWVIAILGMQYLAIPLREWLQLSEPLTLAISVAVMSAFVFFWSGRGRLSIRSYLLLTVLLVVGGYGYMKFAAHR